MRRSALALVGATVLAVGACSGESVLDLSVGDCFDTGQLEGSQVSSIETLDCSTEHDVEVYAEHVFTGEDYPGIDVVEEESDAACRAAFGDFIGLPYEESTVSYSTLYPTEESWQTAEDRTTLCLALVEEPVTGSLEGAAV